MRNIPNFLFYFVHVITCWTNSACQFGGVGSQGSWSKRRAEMACLTPTCGTVSPWRTVRGAGIAQWLERRTRD